MRDHVLFLILTSALAIGAAACGPSDNSSSSPTNPQATPPPAAAGGPAPTSGGAAGNLRLTELDLGRSVNPDNTMHDATVIFIPTDDVWVSVVVEGSGPRATLQARWLTDGGDLVEQASQEITPGGRTVAAFHAAPKPADGWAAGHYRIQVLLNGVAVGSQDFDVRQPPL